MVSGELNRLKRDGRGGSIFDRHRTHTSACMRIAEEVLVALTEIHSLNIAHRVGQVPGACSGVHGPQATAGHGRALAAWLACCARCIAPAMGAWCNLLGDRTHFSISDDTWWTQGALEQRALHNWKQSPSRCGTHIHTYTHKTRLMGVGVYWGWGCGSLVAIRSPWPHRAPLHPAAGNSQRSAKHALLMPFLGSTDNA